MCTNQIHYVGRTYKVILQDFYYNIIYIFAKKSTIDFNWTFYIMLGWSAAQMFYMLQMYTIIIIINKINYFGMICFASFLFHVKKKKKKDCIYCM